MNVENPLFSLKTFGFIDIINKYFYPINIMIVIYTCKKIPAFIEKIYRNNLNGATFS